MSLLYLNWNYTHICNFSCSHCYSRAPQYSEELSFEQKEIIARKLIDLPVFSVGFGGGEPLIKNDFLKVVSILSSGNVHTHFTTNGWGVDTAKAEEIRSSGINRVTVSFDSSISEVHDEIRGKNGSFESAKKAVSNLLSRKVETWLSITLSKINIREGEALLSLAESLGVNGVNYKVIRPSGNASLLKDTLVPTPDDVCHFRSNVMSKSSVKSTMYGPEDNAGCSCGRTTLTIRPEGDVAFCPYSNITLGNLLEDDLVQLYQKAQAHVSSECHGQNGAAWPLASKDLTFEQKKLHEDKLLNSRFARSYGNSI